MFEVYLGSHKDRSAIILFDLEDGKIYSQRIDKDSILNILCSRKVYETTREEKLSLCNNTVFDSSDEGVRIPVKFTVIDT